MTPKDIDLAKEIAGYGVLCALTFFFLMGLWGITMNTRRIAEGLESYNVSKFKVGSIEEKLFLSRQEKGVLILGVAVEDGKSLFLWKLK